MIKPTPEQFQTLPDWARDYCVAQDFEIHHLQNAEKQLQAKIKFYQDQEKAQGWKDAKEPPDDSRRVIVFEYAGMKAKQIGEYCHWIPEWRSDDGKKIEPDMWMDTPKLPEPTQAEG